MIICNECHTFQHVTVQHHLRYQWKKAHFITKQLYLCLPPVASAPLLTEVGLARPAEGTYE